MTTVGTIDHSRLGLGIASIGRAASLGLESGGMKAFPERGLHRYVRCVVVCRMSHARLLAMASHGRQLASVEH